MMLHEADSKMLLVDKDRLNSVFCMDLNRGEVIYYCYYYCVVVIVMILLFFYVLLSLMSVR